MDISNEDNDVISEVANVSLGNTITTLQQILGKNVEVIFPKLELMEEKEINQYLSDDLLRIGIHFILRKDIKGSLIYIFKKTDANILNDVLNRMIIGTTTVLNEIEVSTIKEISNILSGSYLNALGQLSKLTIMPSLPHMIFDTANSIMDFLKAFEKENSTLMLIKNNLKIKGEDYSIDGDLLLVLDQDQLQKLIHNLKKNA